MTVHEDDSYKVFPGKHAKETDPYSGQLPSGTFDKAKAFIKPYNLQGHTKIVPGEANCKDIATDMQSSNLHIQTTSSEAHLSFYWGCSINGDPEADKYRALLRDLRDIFMVKENVSTDTKKSFEFPLEP